MSEQPFIVTCRNLDARAPFRWLQLGWRDWRRASALTAVFGGVIVLVSRAVGSAFGAVFATLFVGLGILMPWLAYSAWHSDRETLDPAAWPTLAD